MNIHRCVHSYFNTEFWDWGCEEGLCRSQSKVKKTLLFRAQGSASTWWQLSQVRLQAPFLRLTLQTWLWTARECHLCTELLRKLVHLCILLQQSSRCWAQSCGWYSTCQALYPHCESFDQGCGQRWGIRTGSPPSLWSSSSSLPNRNCPLTVFSRRLEPCFHALDKYTLIPLLCQAWF